MKRYKKLFKEISSQEEMNNQVKDRMAKYAPIFNKISYDDLIKKDEYKKIFSLISFYLGKRYKGNVTILDYWDSLLKGENKDYPNAKIVSISKRGSKNIAELDNGQQIYLQPKEISLWIEFRLKTDK